MFLRLRVIVALLIAALPMQGNAVARAPCADGHGQLVLAAAAATASAATHDDRHAVRTDATAEAGAVLDGDSSSSGDADALTVASGVDRCAHCAACTVGSALLDSTSKAVAVDAGCIGFLPKTVTAHPRPFGGPERPPRTA